MPEARRHLKSSIRAKMALLGVSLCAGVVIAESVLRLTVCCKSRSLGPLFRKTVRVTPRVGPDPTRNHALIEGVSFVETGAPPGLEYCVFGRISRQGLNDDVVPVDKVPGEKRVLVLGDSFVEAAQVRRDQNFCELLEKGLSQKLRAPVRVINAGVSRYSPLLEYLYYTQKLRQLRPDIVLLAFFPNDVFDDIRYTQIARFDSSGTPLAVPFGDPWSVLSRGEPQGGKDAITQEELRERGFECRRTWVTSSSYLAALIDYTLTAWRIHRRLEHPPLNDEFFVLEGDPRFRTARRQGWASTGRYISLLKEECSKDGATFILTAIPMAAQIYGKSSYDRFFFRGRPNDADQVEMKKIALALEVEFVDLMGPLKQAGRGLYFPRDGHLTPKGHRIAADAIEPYLDKLLRRQE